MHACARLLNNLLALIPAEKKALDDEDLERVEELAEQRARLLWEAWQARDGYDEDELHGQMSTVLEAQRELQHHAERLHAVLKQRQHDGRKQTRYLDGDRYVHAQAQKSFYCDKVS